MKIFGSNSFVVVDHHHLDEVFRASNDELNFFEAMLEDNDFSHTFLGDVYNSYHVGVIRNKLTRNISTIMPSIVDELNAALDDEIDALMTLGIQCNSYA